MTTNQSSVFMGKVLRLREPVEPAEVLWHQMHYSTMQRFGRMCITWSITAGLLAIS